MEKYIVDGWNNFCRIFEMPKDYPRDYCSGGGIPIMIKMVDWFNPVSPAEVNIWAISKERHAELVASGELEKDNGKEIIGEELKVSLIEFLNRKNYIKEGRKYLVMCNFDFDFTFVCKKQC